MVPQGINFYEIITTNKCNLKCTYCFERWNDDGDHRYFAADDEFINDFIPFLMETKGDHPEISLFGGEPFLDWDFVTKFTKRIKQLPFSVALSATTNGITLNSDKIDFLVENFDTLVFSVDGIKAANLNRVDAQDQNSWNKSISNLIETIAKSKTHKAEVAVTMVVNDSNIDVIEQSYDFIANKLGIQCEISFDYATEATEDYLRKVEESLYDMFVVKRWKPFFTMLRKSLNQDFKNGNHFCFHPESSITINAAGQLSFCHLIGPNINDLSKDNDRVYGTMKDGFYNIDFYNQMINRTTFSEWSKDKACNTCEAASWCKGGCIGSHNLLSGDKTFDGLNKNQCEIHKIINKISNMILGE